MAECHRIFYSKPAERVVVDSDGAIHVHRSVDAEPVMNAMKDYVDVIGMKHSGAAGARMYGSLDPITAAILSKACGAGIGTKEFAQFVKKKLQDPDYKRFRFGGA